MYKLIQQIIDTWQWVNILFSLPIQCTIINYHLQLSRLLPNEDDWSTPWAARWFDTYLSQVFIYLPPYLC